MKKKVSQQKCFSEELFLGKKNAVLTDLSKTNRQKYGKISCDTKVNRNLKTFFGKTWQKKSFSQSVSFFNKPVCEVLSWLRKFMNPIQKTTEKQKNSKRSFLLKTFLWTDEKQFLESWPKLSGKIPKNYCILSVKTLTKRNFFLRSCSQQTPLEMAKADFTTLVNVSAEGFKKRIAESRKPTEKSLPSPNKIEYS